MSRFIADENFPHPSFRFLAMNQVDVIHIGLESPSIEDREVLRLASERGRILLTLDNDHGELVYKNKVAAPPGIILFRLNQYRPDQLGRELLRLIELNFKFEGLFSVIGQNTVRQRPL